MTDPQHRRKIAIIMFTDIVGYSALTQKNESLALELLEEHRQLLRPLFLQNDGREVETAGDSFFVEFVSALHATECAIKIQKVIFERNRLQPKERVIQIRIGLHLGDVVYMGKNVHGDGVNIGARIMPFARPGGICISEDIARQIQNKVDLPIVKLGMGELKNIQLPVKIYRVVMPWEKRHGFWEQIHFALKRKRIRYTLASTFSILILGMLFIWRQYHQVPEENKSIAVLPLKLIGDSREDEYLADGITQNMILHLSRTSHLLTISEISSFLYKNSELSDSTIASELGVRFLLKGNFRSTTTIVQLTLSIKDTKYNTDVWKNFFEFRRSEIFANEAQIASKIAQFFDLDYSNTKILTQTVSSQAYELYLKGLYQSRNIGKDANSLAIEYFSEALKVDSKFVDCIVALAHSQAFRYEQNWDTSEKLLIESESNCKHILEIEPENSNAIAILGFIELLKGNQLLAVDRFQEALEKDPSNGVALDNLAKLNLRVLNNPAKGVTLYKKLLEIRPTDWLLNMNLGIGYALLKNYPEAFNSFRKAISLNSREPDVWNNLGYAYEKIANYDSAVVCYSKVLDLDPTNQLAYESMTSLSLALRKFSTAESILIKGTTYLQGKYEMHYLLGIALSFDGKGIAAREKFQDGLALLDRKIKKNPKVGIMYAQKGLFLARLGRGPEAIQTAELAIKLDSMNSDIALNISRIYAILEKKGKMLEWFDKARSMSPEFDAAFIATAIDFEKYRKDPDLLLVARQE